METFTSYTPCLSVGCSEKVVTRRGKRARCQPCRRKQLREQSRRVMEALS